MKNYTMGEAVEKMLRAVACVVKERIDASHDVDERDLHSIMGITLELMRTASALSPGPSLENQARGATRRGSRAPKRSTR